MSAAEPVSPEARLFAGAKLEALYQIATDLREARPQIDLQYVKAVLAGVNSEFWRDSDQYCSMLDYSSYRLELRRLGRLSVATMLLLGLLSLMQMWQGYRKVEVLLVNVRHQRQKMKVSIDKYAMACWTYIA